MNDKIIWTPNFPGTMGELIAVGEIVTVKRVRR